MWDAIDENPIARVTHETIGEFFPTDPPQFYTVPFGFHEPETLRSLLGEAGFGQVEWAYVEKTGTSPSAAEAVIGLIEGNPVLGAILERRPDALPEIKKTVAARIAAHLGDYPVRCGLRALVFSARRPV